VGLIAYFTSHAFQSKDPCSLSNIDQVISYHYQLDLAFDFQNEKYIDWKILTFRLEGSIIHSLRSIKDDLKHVDFDILAIKVLEVRNEEGESLKYKISHPGGRGNIPGDLLRITLKEKRHHGDEFKIVIEYKTEKTDEAVAMTWLKPEQTAGKKHPYMFTQCQSIFCRTLAPFQV
jgi:leukotriene-A4 hydrolase